MPDRNSDYNALAGQKVQRIEALAEGVFAIAMTLLVLDLRVPITEMVNTERDVWFQLASIGPKLISYFLSFRSIERYAGGLSSLSCCMLLRPFFVSSTIT